MQKLLAFTKKVADLPDKPTLNPTELKAQFDAAPEELRTYFNQLIDDLANPGTPNDMGLQSGWTGTATFQRNALGQIRLLFNVTAGTVIDLTNVGYIPDGYQPAQKVPIPLINAVGGRVVPSALYLMEDGTIRTTVGNGLTSGVLYQGEILYYGAQ